MLVGAKATLISSGGLNGAEGSVTLVVDGNEESLEKLLRIMREIKRAKLPEFETPTCDNCKWPTCSIYDIENIMDLL